MLNKQQKTSFKYVPKTIAITETIHILDKLPSYKIILKKMFV